MPIRLRLLAGEFAVCRLEPGSSLPAVPERADFVSLTVTDQEISLVTPADRCPPEARADRGWRALYAAGPMPFELTGVIASLTGILAAAGLPVFVTSTFDGDVLLVRADSLDCAVSALEAAGHQVDR
ncbi:MAG TPA: ACT domain-containing protein [Mycobacteriales bacterium]|nr:ACT domain-containing protein [Mycobacteriales bacterium]